MRLLRLSSSRISAVVGIGLLLCWATGASARLQQPPEWRLIPDGRIGSDQDFTHVVAVLPAADGSVAIADDRNHEILVFARNGAYTHRIGGVGRGPGEFLRLRGVGVLGDSLWVLDSGQRRVALFARDGSSLGTIRNESGGWLTALVPGGALGTAAAALGSREMFRDERLPILRMTRSGETIDTIAWMHSRNQNVFVGPGPDGRYALERQPFSDAGLTILAADASRVHVVDRTATTTSDDAMFRVTALDLRGDTLWNRTYPYAPRRNTRVDSVWNAIRTRLTRRGHSEDAIRSVVFLPEYYPPVTSGFASDGLLWLRREEGQPHVDYWVIRDDGQLIASLTVPANLTLLAALDSEVWGVETDAYDVPSVVRFRLQR